MCPCQQTPCGLQRHPHVQSELPLLLFGLGAAQVFRRAFDPRGPGDDRRLGTVRRAGRAVFRGRGMEIQEFRAGMRLERAVPAWGPATSIPMVTSIEISVGRTTLPAKSTEAIQHDLDRSVGPLDGRFEEPPSLPERPVCQLPLETSLRRQHEGACGQGLWRPLDA